MAKTLEEAVAASFAEYHQLLAEEVDVEKLKAHVDRMTGLLGSAVSAYHWYQSAAAQRTAEINRLRAQLGQQELAPAPQPQFEEAVQEFVTGVLATV